MANSAAPPRIFMFEGDQVTLIFIYFPHPASAHGYAGGLTGICGATDCETWSGGLREDGTGYAAQPFPGLPPCFSVTNSADSAIGAKRMTST